jgi:hypothetical protein
MAVAVVRRKEVRIRKGSAKKVLRFILNVL